ncbi:MAG: putative Ig domain-containing protein [Thermoplasmatota archaeon]
MKVEGQGSLTSREGALVAGLKDGRIISDRDIVSYYMDSNEPIVTEFELIGEGSFRFRLDKYDKDRTVIIDPLIFSTFIGGALADNTQNLFTDTNGEIIVVGRSTSTDFPTTPGAFNRTLAGSTDIVVSKLKEDGSALAYSTFIGGSLQEYVYNSKMDKDGNVYIFGLTYSSDFPTTSGAWDRTYGGGTQDAYLTKLKADGSSLSFSTFIGGSGDEDSYGGLWISSNGDAVVAGTTSSVDFTTTSGAYDTTHNGNDDIFVVRLSSDGTSAVYSTYIGGSMAEAVSTINKGLQVNRNGSVYIMGTSQSTNFPITSGAFQNSLAGSSDIVYIKLKSDGSDLLFSTFIGGVSTEYVSDYYWDEHENLVLSGETASTNFPTTNGAFDIDYNGGSMDVFLLKMKNDATDLYFSTFVGGSVSENIIAISPGSGNSHIISGQTQSADFPMTIKAFDKDHSKEEIFISKFNGNGSTLMASTYLGGDEYDQISNLYVSDGILSIMGRTNSTNFLTTGDAYDDTHNGNYDAFVTFSDEDLSMLEYSTYIGGSQAEVVNGYIDEIGDVFVYGYTQSTDYPTTAGAYDTSHNSGADIFVTKMFGGFNSEPLEVFSIETFSDPSYSIRKTSFDTGEEVFLELRGSDSNASRRDFAGVNISFGWSPVNLFSIRLRETGENTGVYQGKFTVPMNTLYCDTISATSRKDPTKSAKVFIEPPFRPTSVSDVELYMESGFTNAPDKFDHGDFVYIKVTGVDAHPMLENYALVNVTSQKNSTFRLLLALMETGLNTGVYTGSFLVPGFLEYFDNITVYSVRNEGVDDTFMLHTPVQIRPLSDVTTAKEDEEYRAAYWNFGYEPSTWALDTLATWLKWNETSNELYGIPNNNHVGKWDVTLTLEDSKGHVDEHKFKIDVENTPPEIQTDPVTSATENVDYSCDFNSSDDGQGEITWTLIGSAPWLTMGSNSGLLWGKPLMEDVGLYNLSVIVNDGNGGISSIDFQLTVIGEKKAPRIITADITTGKQGEKYYRDYEAYDPDGRDSDLVWSLATDATFLEMDEQYGVVQGIPGKYDVGTFNVLITVTDLDGLSANHSFELTIENINDKPEWVDVPEDMDIIHGEWFVFDVNATDPDPGTFLEYTLTSDPETNITINSQTGMLKWLACISCFPTTNYFLSVNLKVSDGDMFSLYSFTITVIPTEPPIVTLTSPGDGVKMASDQCIISWEGVDPEGDPITYDVYISENQAYVVGLREEALFLSDFGGTSLNVGDLSPGKLYYWLVRPHDGCTFGECSSGVMSFKINSKPTIDTIQPMEAKTGEEFSYKVKASDLDQEDSGNLLYSLVEAPEGMTIKEDTGMIRWKPGSDQKGDHVITVEVSDGLEKAVISFDLEVLKGDEGGISLVLIVIIVIVLLLVIGVILFLVFFRKKEVEEEVVDEESEEIAHQIEEHQRELNWEQEHYHHHEKSPASIAASAMEAHEHDHDKHEKYGYKDLYGSEPPEMEEGSEPEEGSDEIKEGEEEQVEPPEEEEDYLTDLISHMDKKTADIETYGQDLKTVKTEMKAVDDPYDHFGENEEDIEK